MVEVKICVGTDCAFKGSLDLLEYLENYEPLKGKIELITCSCIERACKPDNAPVVIIGEEVVTSASLDKVLMRLQQRLALAE